MANGDGTITRVQIIMPLDTTLAELAGRWLTTEQNLAQLNAAEGIDLNAVVPGETEIWVPNEVPLGLPFADWFWTIQQRQVATGQPVITPREWLDTDARNAALQTYVPQVAQFIGPGGSDTRPDFERPRLDDPGFEATPSQLIAQGRDVNVTPGSIEVGDPGTGLGTLSFAQAPPPGAPVGTPPGEGAEPGDAGTGTFQDIDGDGRFTATDVLDETFGPQGEVPPPPGWVWAFDPSLGDFTLRKTDPVADTSRLDEWVFVPGPTFEENPQDGNWERIENPEITDPLKNVPVGVRPWLGAVLNGDVDVAQIQDPVVRDWVRFTLRGITDASLRRGEPPENLPFGSPAPQITQEPTRTFDTLSDAERKMLAPFGITEKSSPQQIDDAINFISATPPDDLALFRRQERVSEGGRADQPLTAPPTQAVPPPTETPPQAVDRPDQQAQPGTAPPLTPSDVSPSQNDAGTNEATQAQIDNNRGLQTLPGGGILGLDTENTPIQPFILPPPAEQ